MGQDVMPILRSSSVETVCPLGFSYFEEGENYIFPYPLRSRR